MAMVSFVGVVRQRGVSGVPSLPADTDLFGPRGANPLQCRADEHSLKVSSGDAASAHIY